MHLFTLATTAAALVGSTTAVPTVSHVLHEKRDAPPKNWVKRSRLIERDSNVKLPMRIGLTQSNLHIGDELLLEVSRHDSPKFGQWYTAEETIELFAPKQESVDAVRDWLESAGILGHRIALSVNKQWLQFDASVVEVESILKTQYWEYEHAPSGSKHVGCDEYHVPAHVQHHVDYITPGLNLRVNRRKVKEQISKRGFRGKGGKFSGPIVKGPAPSSFRSLTTSGANSLDNCDALITPDCISAMYNITQATKAAEGNELGIFEEGDYYSAQDFALFFETLAPNVPSDTLPILNGIDGGTVPGDYAGIESDLDFQVSYPIIYPQNSILFQTDDVPYAEEEEYVPGFLNTFLDAIDGSYCSYSAFGETGNDPINDPIYPDPNPYGYDGAYEGELQCGVYKPTNVISISYGESEDDLPANYQQRQCNEFMKLGLQGTSVLVASGDYGVAGRPFDNLQYDGCLGDNGTIFNPDFPAGCPYLTSVGGTYLPPGAFAVGDNEVAVNRFPSGGGFSNVYPVASYQSAAVAKYFATSDPQYPYYNTSGINNPVNISAGGIYNRGGRGSPDVSAIGDNVVIYNAGTPYIVGGTSASTPVFAAILNRINEERLAVGKSTVGFVNPTLYANPQVLHDITVGNNSGCGTAGFFAVEGWDPVTGLGTPNYPALLELYMSLP